MENVQVEKNANNFNHNSRLWTGIFLVVVGAVLMAVKMGVDVPRWLYSWEAFLITLGLVSGIRSKFRNPGPLIMIFIGVVFLADEYFTNLNFHAYIWPAGIILLGLFFIFRPKTMSGMDGFFSKKHYNANDQQHIESGFQPIYDDAFVSSEEALDITAVFGSVKKKLVTKTFRGGDVTAFMGGAEIDLTGADIQNTAVIDVSAVFGGVKLVVPSDWKVQNKATAVFGGIEDKRVMSATTGNKLLIIDGAAVFGGIELNSY